MSYADYVRKKMKNTIRYGEAEGNPITITDALNRPIKGIKVFGESTQNGTPTQESPVNITSVENPILTIGGESIQPQQVTIPYALRGLKDTNGNITVRDEIVVNVAQRTVTHINGVNELVLSGTERLYMQGSGANTHGIISFYCYISSESASTSTVVNSISSHFVEVTDSYTGIIIPSYFVQRGASDTILYIRTLGTEFPNVATFKTWLATQKTNGTPVTVCWARVVPTTTDITNTELGQALLDLHTNKGTTVISLDTDLGNIWVKYARK